MGLRNFLLSILFIGFSYSMGFAQQNFNTYLMPTVNVDYPVTEGFRQEFEFENRNFIYREGVTDLVAKHLELSNFSTYQHKNRKFTFGIKYRFEANENDEDELRLVQQYEWKKNADAPFSHRIRVEERIYRSITKIRFRYKTALNVKPKTFVDNIYFSNELAIETNKIRRLEYENRLGAETGWNFMKKSAFLTGAQYRLSDFTNVVSHNLFLTFSLQFKL